MGLFFRAVCTGTRPGGSHVHRDMVSIIKCTHLRAWTNTFVKSPVRTTSPPSPPSSSLRPPPTQPPPTTNHKPPTTNHQPPPPPHPPSHPTLHPLSHPPSRPPPHHHQVPSCPRSPGSFRGDLAVFVGPSGWPRCCGCTRRCRRRHGMCPPPERATPPLALASRADGGRNGICRVSAPQRTAPEDGKGQGRGTRSTTRPRSGSASPSRGAGQHLCLRSLADTGSAACRGASCRPCTVGAKTRCSCAADGGSVAGH